jgi:hypothetical protein
METHLMSLDLNNGPTLKAIAVRRRDAADMIGQGVSKIDYLIATGQVEARKSGKPSRKTLTRYGHSASASSAT